MAITISGHYERMGSVLCRTNTDELTDQAAGTVYHCGPACAALANRSVTPILYPDQFHRRLHLPPFAPWSPDPFSSLPPSDPFVITSIHFTLKAASVARPFETSPARVAFLLQITTHSLSPSPLSPVPKHCSFYNGPLNLFSKFPRLQAIAFARERGYISTNV